MISDEMPTATEGFNALNFPAPTDGSWATTNLAEALPGVATPLGWSIWSTAADLASRAPFYAMGAMPARDMAYPYRSEDRVVNLFYGRIAIRVDFFCQMGDLVPGATGEAVARDAFGFVPPGFESRTSKRRWPAFFVKMPIAFARTPSRVRRAYAENDAWYRQQIGRFNELDLAGARRLYGEAKARYERTMPLQATAIACVIQPVYTALSKTAAEAGVDAAELMRAQGSHEEAALIENLWRVSRDQLSLEEFLLQHGYHGPNEGELSNFSWREDPGPVEALIAAYRGMPDDASPMAKAAVGTAQRERAETALLAAVPASRRGGVRLVLRLARTHLPLRSVGKLAYMRVLDVARGAARRTGELLVADGVLDEPGDVFYLTSEELVGAMPDDPRATVATRRALRESYRRYELPAHWTGLPQPTTIAAETGAVENLAGIGVSPGIVEGRIRVVTDPATTEMEADDILVAHTTDPSWASIMFIAKALVVDIGGQLSHAAVVARELGVPCVMDTQVGTRALRTGDWCRVDGHLGTVEVLTRRGD
jgi:pyruvate, water dikinase